MSHFFRSSTMMNTTTNTTVSSENDHNDDDPFMVLSQSNSEIKAITYMYYLTPPISLVSSVLLLYSIEQGSKPSGCLQHLKRPFLRFLLGFAAMDIIHSVGSLIFGPWSVFEDTPYVWNASGNITTCNANGFFSNMLLGLVIHSAFHASYSAMTIYFGLKEEYIVRYIEPSFHIFVWGWTISTGMVMIFHDMMNPLPSNPGICWSGDYPPDCAYEDDVDCIRGATKNHGTQALVFIGGSVGLSFVLISISFGLILYKVRHTEEKLNKWVDRNSGLSGSFLSVGSAHSSRSDRVRQSNQSSRRSSVHGQSFQIQSSRRSSISHGQSFQSKSATSHYSQKFKPLTNKVGNQALAYIGSFVICNFPLLISACGPRYSANHAKTYYTVNALLLEILTPLQGACNALIFFINNPSIFRRGGPLYFMNRFQKWIRCSCCYSKWANNNLKSNSIMTSSQEGIGNRQGIEDEDSFVSLESFCVDLTGIDEEELSKVNSCMSNMSPESSSDDCSPKTSCLTTTTKETRKQPQPHAESVPLQCVRISSDNTLFRSSVTYPSEIEPIPEESTLTKFGLANREGSDLPVDICPVLPLRRKEESEEESEYAETSHSSDVEVSSSEECSTICLSLGSYIQKLHSFNPTISPPTNNDDDDCESIEATSIESSIQEEDSTEFSVGTNPNTIISSASNNSILDENATTTKCHQQRGKRGKRQENEEEEEEEIIVSSPNQKHKTVSIFSEESMISEESELVEEEDLEMGNASSTSFKTELSTNTETC